MPILFAHGHIGCIHGFYTTRQEAHQVVKFSFNILIVLFALTSLLFQDPAFGYSRFGVSGGVGVGKRLKAYRLSAQSTSPLFVPLREHTALTGYWEGSYNYVKGKLPRSKSKHGKPVFVYTTKRGKVITKLNGLSFGHTFVLYKNAPYIDPYLEAGLGLGVFDKRKLVNRNLGMNALFEIKFSAGFRIGPRGEFDLSYKFIHFSNAYWVRNNDGLNLNFVILNYWF